MNMKAFRLLSLSALFLAIILATMFLTTALTEDIVVTSNRLCGGDPVPGGHPTSYHPSNTISGDYALCGGDPVPGGHPNGNATQG